MYGPKRYGESKVPTCPFCEKTAVARNAQGVPVCESHRSKRIDSIKCACGSSLELRVGKWGPYGVCESCGNLSWTKVCEINSFGEKPKVIGGQTITMTSTESDIGHVQKKPQPSKPRELTITSIDCDVGPEKSKARPKGREITLRSDEID